MPTEIEFIYRALQGKSIARPLFSTRVAAGFPSPSESYIEGRIDLNKELLRHPLATFYVRVSGDSMIGVGIHPNSLLVVDRAEEARDGHVIIARLGDELCVKRLSFGDHGEILLISENDRYPAIRVKPEDDFEVWGRVVYSIQTH